jgi:diguanylate cyclase (GGDEF)-like protein/PAS domain S-box-containing protein
MEGLNVPRPSRALLVGALVFLSALVLAATIVWTLSVAPSKGWTRPFELSFQALLGLLFSLMLGYLAKLLITVRTEAEQALLKAKQQAQQYLNIAGVMLIVLDLKGRVELVNRRGCEILGAPEEEILGRDWFEDFLPERIRPEIREIFIRLLEGGTELPEYFENRVLTRGGEERVVAWHSAVLRDESGSVNGVLASGEDITERKQAEERIRQLAYFDPLTGLPNRILLSDRANHDLSTAQRKRMQLAVMSVDLDHFKNVNDTLGHRVGDELLIEVANRLQSVVREADTVSRQGGDEFVVILSDTDADGAAHVAGKLLQAGAQPYQIETIELTVTLSIGIAIYPADGKDFEMLSKCADAAMNRAKQGGRNSYCFFTTEMQEHSARSLQMENALRRALERKQLFLHYQPQISLRDGRIVGVEVLLRWRHPELGMIPPADFIPIAEESGQILRIGEWVLRSAVGQVKSWMDAGLPPMMMAVNLSAIQFRHPHLPELVTRILEEEGLEPRYLELELTEGAAMGDAQVAIGVMDRLHERGIRISIDDFGTGYSSLSYLRRFKVYKLKIDKSFVQDIGKDPEGRAIIVAIISLAESLGLRTIAEGVETDDQLEFLRDQGCNEVQGYYFSKPLPADEFDAFVRARHASAT